MTSVRQLAEGLITYLRGFLGSEEREDAGGAAEQAQFAREREQIARERAEMQSERAERQILDWKRQGRLRATEKVEKLARALLASGGENVVRFDAESVPVSALFAQFVSENGPVVALGELLPGDRQGALGRGTASERLTAMAREKARQEGLSYVQSFAAVATEHPELAREARGE